MNGELYDIHAGMEPYILNAELSPSPVIESSSNTSLFDTLRKVFGFREFRPNQEQIVRAILEKRDVFAVMPTGGGKSLCYQLPAVILPGTCIVISPLISLMKDQVDGGRANGIRAAFLNSSLSSEERDRVMHDLLSNSLDLLYVAPERFTLNQFRDILARVKISMAVIDEAHCISEWGHDFRPDYLSLSALVTLFPNLPVAAFTATATHLVQQDILDKLALRNPHLVRASFDRPNLTYDVRLKEKVDVQLVFLLKKFAFLMPKMSKNLTKNIVYLNLIIFVFKIIIF